jgi:hypothetical protein
VRIYQPSMLMLIIFDAYISSSRLLLNAYDFWALKIDIGFDQKSRNKIQRLCLSNYSTLLAL